MLRFRPMKYGALIAGLTSLTSLASLAGVTGCGGGKTGQSGSAGSSGQGGIGAAGAGGGGGSGGLGNIGGMVTTSCPGSSGTGGSTASPPPACTSNPSDYQYRFQDPCAPIEARIDDLLMQLTSDEKLGLMSEYQLPVTRLGLAPYTTFTEGLHGVGWARDPRPSATAGSTNVLYLTGTQFPQ